MDNYYSLIQIWIFLNHCSREFRINYHKFEFLYHYWICPRAWTRGFCFIVPHKYYIRMFDDIGFYIKCNSFSFSFDKYIKCNSYFIHSNCFLNVVVYLICIWMYQLIMISLDIGWNYQSTNKQRSVQMIVLIYVM